MSKLIEAQATFAHNVARLIVYIFEEGYWCTLGESYRTKEQCEIYAKEGVGIKNSLHRDRLAIDLNIFLSDGSLLQNSKDYELFGSYWEKLHPKNRAGVFWKTRDSGHFEYHPDFV